MAVHAVIHGQIPGLTNVYNDVQVSSVGALLVTGSVQVANLPNQSVSGTIGSSIIGTVPVTQVTSPWVITGSVQGSFAPSGNQSVSGTVNVGNFPATQAVTGSVAVLQGTNPFIITGSVQASITPAANQSVSGTVQVDVRGSVATVIIGGSIAASFTPPANQSVSGTVGASLIGLSPVSVSNFPTNQNVSGSVVATQGTTPWTVVSSVAGGIFPISGSVAAVVTNFPTTQNVSGSVAAWLQSSNASVITVGSPVANQSVSGTVTVNQGTTPWVQTGSVQGTVSVLGTVPVTQSTSPWVVSGSVQTLQGGTNITSISGVVPVSFSGSSIQGTFAEDTPHSTGHNGIFVLAVRNDTLASVASNDNDYTQFGVDSAGRQITKPFAAGQASVTSHNSIVSAGTIASVQLFAAAGAGIKNYITDFNIANTGTTTTLVIFGDGDGSVLGRTIAPAGGGSNHQFATPLVNVRANTPINLQLLSSSSIVYATVTGFRAP